MLIVGGGIVGTALAWALAERGVRDVVVVDLDLAGVYASSELNAGGARATWWQPVNIEACRLTLDFFRAHADEFGFRERGYLWLYEDEVLFATAREKLALQNGAGLGVELLAPSEVQARFPILDRGLGRLLGATFSPRDGLVNPNAVRAWFRREARARGVVFRDRDYVTRRAHRARGRPRRQPAPGGGARRGARQARRRGRSLGRAARNPDGTSRSGRGRWPARSASPATSS